MDLSTSLSIVLLAPLLSAGLIALFCREKGGMAAILSISASGVAMVLTLVSLFTWDLEPTTVAVNWMTLGGLDIDIGYHFNSLSALMLFVVSFVGFWIHVFSAGYMREDVARGRYFGGLSIFMFSMLGIVLAGNLFMLFIFWELVGFSSYMLIGHYFEKQSAADASKKAFIVNRVGDFGFLIGIVMCYWHYGTVDIAELGSLLAADPASAVTMIGFCLFCGVLGKSAQMPLHVWLPDAMEGPTPVSALIHAATMVAAGVYFLCRVYFIFSADALTVIMWVGTATAVFAAFCALAQGDIKRVLAYSTLSQLGYMVAIFALGTKAGMHPGAHVAALAGVAAAMFHLTTHAFFKALLFLGSGSVINACHHEQDIFRMGGLAKRMKITFATFTIGVIAISGVPWIGAGFYSKDAILYLAFKNHMAIFAILGFTALLTAFYMGRVWVIAFLGEAKSDAAERAVESSWEMTLPLIVLGALSTLLGGTIGLYPEAMRGILQHLMHPHGSEEMLMIGLSAGCSLLGLIGAWLFYRAGAREDRLQRSVPGVFGVLRSRLLFDELYNWYVASVQQRAADFLGILDQIFISGLMVRGSAGIVGLIGLLTRATHVGSIHGYVYWFLAGLIIYWGFAVGWF